MEEKLTDQEEARRAKLPQYKALGVDPFGQRYDWKDQIRDLRAKYGERSAEELSANPVTVKIAGRIMSIRDMGKAAFFNVKDEYGTIQVWIGKNKALAEDKNFEVFKLEDIGDICGVEGTLMKSRTGELTIRCETFTHLSKALKPLPEKFHGLTDLEERCRRRYVDLIVNDDSRRTALLRPAIIKEIRRYCDDLGFTEVETPILNPIAGGASARPFITHHNALDKDFYLRIATELNLKKCMIGGIDRVYEIGRIFRNEGMDNRHNPEFTTIELYQAYGDLRSMMEWAEGLFHSIAKRVVGKDQYEWNGNTIDLDKPFAVKTMAEAIKEKTGIDFTEDIPYEKAVELAKEHHVPLEPAWNSTGYIMQAFFDEFVEPTLIQPTFITTYPIEVSPLTKKTADPRFVDRFELFIGGIEFGNAYSELNNPFDQMERFQAQLAARNRGDDEANEIDYSFMDAMEYGMQPAGGIGVGIDRLCMFFCEEPTIREVLLFPTLKTIGTKKEETHPEGKTEEESKSEVPSDSTGFFISNDKIDFSGVKIEPLFQDQVDFDTFSKSDFRAVKVKECVPVEKSKKLLKFVLDDGTGTDRVILSGIHAYYEPEELVGKTLIAITNLPPKSMMGIDSCGMLLSAVNERNGKEELHLLMVDNHIPAGAKLY